MTLEENLALAKASTSPCNCRNNLSELLAQPLDEASNAKFVASVQTSLLEQQKLESKEQGPFETFVTSYYD